MSGANDNRRPATATSRVLAAMVELGDDEREVVALIAERLVERQLRQGLLRLERDERDLRGEAAAELLDATTLLAFELIRRTRGAKR